MIHKKAALAVAALPLLATACSMQGTQPASIAALGEMDRCSAVSGTLFGAREAQGRWVAADANAALPAYCEVTGTLSPAAGSNIGVVYRLPANWNGKLLGIGGGGWAGNVTLMGAAEGLKKGYATLQTDAGHSGTSVWDLSWTSNPEAVTDFQYRAIHEMTVAGKQLARAYYGRPQDRSYFQGCSTGGRMALMEAQRFPGDYEAIISAAPVYSLQVQTSAVLRNNTFAQPGAGFSKAQLQLVNDAVLKACDAQDGVTDDVIPNPRTCNWKPAELQCRPGQSGQCLSSAQVNALETLYRGIRTPDGEWAMFPLSMGGELGWPLFIGTEGTGQDATGGGGLTSLTPLILGQPTFDFSRLNPDTDVPRIRSSEFARAYEAVSPDLSAFFGRGGKLILWHGENDPGPSPVGTIDYANKVARAVGTRADQSLRTFMLPGVEHCRGGPGADMVDTIDAVDRWIETGQAPDVLIATKADSAMKRLVCRYPQVARYRGSGDQNDPQNWTCVANQNGA
ncbi:tannase/feruloyl esterase family alpha/beta hydrolase [Altericroceibacterium xinjiangense]|uniref:tannase/feruloyl esterase family alpha/beta hydrolase n=1 Tax=Altericroceibacterium xinjiangense TaxID=762261 RepID=UPI000F7E0996|nr:tannase/feruloyl esterase family alpha/beta hydrolase [Altericroceibacterium xinjiangense]